MEFYLKKRKLNQLMDFGSGSFGSVVLAQDESGNKIIVKRIPSITRNALNNASYLREVFIMNNTPSHPDIPRILYNEEFDNHGFLEQEYVNGLSVDALSYLFGKTSISFLLKFSKKLIGVLDFLHSHNIYHMDVNEGNVLICEDHVDPELPLTIKLIDFGLSCKTDSDFGCGKKDMKAAVSVFTWPYKHIIEDSVPGFSKSPLGLATDDLWQAASLIYHIAFGSFDNFATNFGNPMLRLYYFGHGILKEGGYPVPPAKGHNKNVVDPEQYQEIMSSLGDQQRVANLYKEYVIEGDPLFLFNPNKESIVHDILRLMMPRNVEDIFTSRQLLDYIEGEWFETLKYGYLGQRSAVNSCYYPCEDPLNSFYKKNCDSCTHCQWVDTPVKIKNHKTRCIPRNKLRQDEIAKTECLRAGNVWNPYRKNCEIISDESTKLLSNRYSVLFSDGLESPISGAEIRRRIKEKDYSLLNPDEVVIEKLKEFSYHPLHTIQSHSFFFDYYNTRITEDYSDLEKLDLTEFKKHLTRKR